MAAHPQIDRDKRLQLIMALQTTLDVETLIEIFSHHLQALVAHRAVRYLNEAADIDVATAELGERGEEIPLSLESEPLGSLHLYCNGACSEAQLRVAEALAAALIHPLRNALMYREALNASARDPLTGVNNRSSFRSVLDREVELSRRHGAPLSLVMMDVDRFKSINDEHGHLAGDLALRSIAQCMLGCIRESDILFRYGGEEFCIALANTNLAGARKLAERVRRALEILVVRASGARVHVTASFGVATLGAGEDSTRLVEKADQSLYRAKVLGRNRIATQDDTDPAIKAR